MILSISGRVQTVFVGERRKEKQRQCVSHRDIVSNGWAHRRSRAEDCVRFGIKAGL